MGLRSARRGAEGQYQARMVALHGRHPWRRGGRRHLHHPADSGVGRVRPRGRFQRSAGGVSELPQAPAFRQAGGIVRREAWRQAAGERYGRHRVPGLRNPRQVDRTARLQHDAAHPPRPGRGRELPALSASGNRPGHLRGLQERDDLLPQEAAVRHRQHGQVLP